MDIETLRKAQQGDAAAQDEVRAWVRDNDDALVRRDGGFDGLDVRIILVEDLPFGKTQAEHAGESQYERNFL